MTIQKIFGGIIIKRRKTALLLSTLAICSTMMVTANAESQSTELEYTIKNDPTYTVEIPAKIKIAKDGSDMTIKASNVNYLDGQKVSVSIAGTSYFRNQMVLTNSETRAVMRYQIVKEDGTVIETNGQQNQVNGVEVASFTNDGEVTDKVLPVELPSSTTGDYSGTITFDIGLVDAK